MLYQSYQTRIKQQMSKKKTVINKVEKLIKQIITGFLNGKKNHKGATTIGYLAEIIGSAKLSEYVKFYQWRQHNCLIVVRDGGKTLFFHIQTVHTLCFVSSL